MKEEDAKKWLYECYKAVKEAESLLNTDDYDDLLEKYGAMEEIDTAYDSARRSYFAMKKAMEKVPIS